jgi:mannosyltransferase
MLATSPATLMPQGPPAPGRRPAIPAALLIGLFAFVVSAASSWVPSYWGDEAATVMSAQRTLPSLFMMLGHIDAVHGVYYLFQHFWTGAFGISEFATRFPSAVAVGFAASGTVVLVRRLTGDARWALLSGILFAILPRTTYMGAEARSYALVTALAVWSTVLLVHVIRRESSPDARLLPKAFWWWTAYALLFALTINVFIYAVLLVPAHAVLVWYSAHRRRPWAWMTATAVAGLLALPVLSWSVREREQVAFIARRPGADFLDASVYQWFDTKAIAVVAWALIVLAVILIYSKRGRPEARHTMTLALVWMLFPTIVLLVGTHLVTPMYTFRYLSMCSPAVAVAMAAGVGAIRVRFMRPAAFLLVVVLVVPAYLAQRGPYAKNEGSDWRQVADVLAREAQPGDAVVFDESVRPSRRPRLAMHLYPQAFQGLRDVTLKTPYQQVPWLWDRILPLSEVPDRLGDIRTVWLVQNKGSREYKAGTDERMLEAAGFAPGSSRLVNITVVTRMSRTGATG